jgi:hypothetical protein
MDVDRYAGHKLNPVPQPYAPTDPAAVSGRRSDQVQVLVERCATS